MEKNPEIQFRSPEDIKSYQEEQLAKVLAYLQAHSKFYQQMFAEHHIDINQIKTIEDLQQIPVTTKTDLQLHNDDFICVDKEEIIDYVTTSGTLGDPVTFVLTSEDLDRLSYNEYLSFTTTGCTKQDILQLMTTIDRRFMAGLAYYMGARELGYGSDPCRQRHPGTAMGHDSTDTSDLWNGGPLFPYQTDRVCRKESYRP